MCIDQILMPYWESLTLLLKCHYVKITVWQTRCCWEHPVGYFELTLTVSLSFLPGVSLSHTCMWRSSAVWEWLLRNSREPPALLLSPLHFFIPPPPMGQNTVFSTHPRTRLVGSPTLKMSPPLKPHAFLTLLSIEQTSVLDKLKCFQPFLSLMFKLETHTLKNKGSKGRLLQPQIIYFKFLLTNCS